MKHPVFVLMLWLGILGTAGAVEPVTLTAGAEPVPLAGHIEVLRDDSGALTLDEVRSPTFAAQFQHSNSANFNFGFTPAAYWFRFVLSNPAQTSGDWVLEIGFPTLDYLDLHLLGSDGHSETLLTGDQRQAPAAQFPHHRFAFPLQVATGETRTVYMRVANAGAFIVVPTVWSEAGFRNRATNENLAYGAFFGVMLVMLFYNLIIWLRIRDPAYLYFVFTLLFFIVLSLDTSGYARQYGNDLFVQAPLLIQYSFPVSGLGGTIFLLLFGREFIQAPIVAPVQSRLTLGLAGLCAVAVFVGPAISYRVAIQMMLALSSLATVVLVPGVAYLAYRGQRTARLYLLAFGVFLLISLLGTLQVLKYLPGSFFVGYFLPIGLNIAVTLLSLSLADRLYSERREKERLTRLRNFFAPQVAEAILDEGGSSLLAPKRREVTVVFTDLRGFTALAAQSEPEDVIRVLREYHEAVVETTAKHGGNVEHIAGDGVMVYFNAPIEVTEPEARAVRMAFELRSQFETLCQTWRKRGHELGVGIGMACGFATVGAVGAKGRMDYSCIGTVTNLAARLCGLAKHGQILTTQQFVNRVESLVMTEPLGEQDIKGIPKPVPVLNLKDMNTISNA